MPENLKKDFIALAKERFKQAEEDEKEIRAEAEKDLKFVAGDQWDELIKQDRVQAKRPVLTFNRLPTYVQQVANEARQNKAEIKFAPTDDEATQDTADVIEGLARHIQYTSDAGIAYETALEYAVACSFAFYRFLTGYCDDDSFDQELKVVPVYDPFSVYGVLLPAIFGRPVPWAFVVANMPKEEYRRDYGDTDAATQGFQADALGDWVSDDTIRIAEYWYVDYKKETIILQADGSVTVADASTDFKSIPDANKREVQRATVKFCKINGMEVLPGSETEWLGSTIPIIPCLGKQLIVKGKPKLFSLIRFLREPQQLINYAKTRIAETLATAPISPFIGAVGAFQGREQQWRDINLKQQAYVEYNILDPAGKPIPPPARQTFEPPIASLSEFTAQEVDDLKAISGIFDQSLGEGTNDQSGLAIQRRQRQSSATNLHFIDNLERAQKKGAPIIAEMIKPIYGSTARMIRILGADEAPKIVKINQDYQKGNETVNHDLSKGKYDLIVTVGKSFSTKRMESFDMMTSVLQGQPQLMLMIGDIFFKNADTAGADQMAERFKRIISMTHPGLIDQENDPIPPQAKAAIVQAQQQTQAMHAYAQQQEQEVQKLTQEKQAKIIDNEYKAAEADKDRIARVTIAEVGAKTQLTSERMKWEHEAWKITHQAAHDAGLQAQDHANALEQGDKQAENQAALAQQGQDHTLEQGQQSGDQAAALAQLAQQNQPEQPSA